MVVCDYLIIGGGNTGILAAENLNKLNKEVILVESTRLGGNTLNSVTIPKEVFYKETKQFSQVISYLSNQSESLQRLYEAREFIPQRVRSKILQKTNSLTKKLEYLSKVKLIYGNVSLITKNIAEVDLNDRKISVKFQKCLLCVGKDSLEIQDLEGIEKVNYMTKYSAYFLTEIPNRMAIIGLTIESMEVAAYYASIGVEITIYEKKMFEQLLPELDRYLLKHLVQKLEYNFVDIKINTEVKKIKKKKNNIIIFENGGRASEYSHVYVHTHESFDNHDLNLKKLKVKYTEKGIWVNKHHQTYQKNIFAFGSCTHHSYDKFRTVQSITEFTQNESKNERIQHKKLSTRIITNTLDVFATKLNKNKRFNRVSVSYFLDFYGMGVTESFAKGKYGPKIKISLITNPSQTDFLKIIYFEKSQKIVGVWATAFFKARFESLIEYAFENESQANKIINTIQFYMFKQS